MTDRDKLIKEIQLTVPEFTRAFYSPEPFNFGRPNSISGRRFRIKQKAYFSVLEGIKDQTEQEAKTTRNYYLGTPSNLKPKPRNS